MFQIQTETKMGSSSSLDSQAPRTITLLEQVLSIDNLSDRSFKIDEVIKTLETEMGKIDAFKAVIPQCMILLKDAIQLLNEEKRRCVSDFTRPLTESFSPLLDNSVNIAEKRNWLSLSSSTHLGNNTRSSSVEAKECVGGAREIKPFDGFAGFNFTRTKDRVIQPMPGLSLGGRGTMYPSSDHPSSYIIYKSSVGLVPYSSCMTTKSSLQTPIKSQFQIGRKPRRSWDENLHRLFERALEYLGGPLVATPKAIRQHMNIQGLTNDEVKSHLQKYRQHNKNFPQRSSSENRESANSGGLRAPSAKSGASKRGNFKTESPQGPLQMMASRRGASATGGDSMEDDDDGGSESSKPRNTDA
ncbi:hypothetical protein GIB67_029611 [Kingdonia uniflora]|uniref:HHO5-like N-terminal domain-containing protein n=1 Tax=Kingdonia uniflora TaxID=39325 RepID=A0A7J7LLL4_9MAGN|nr:hypothetical protein GIB67_029611 [Kingdonia uniflora]